MRLSIVTTLYRSAAHIEEFYQRVSAAARKQTDDYEILMVDDGSPDASAEVTRRLAESDPKITVIELSRNFGHHKAMMTGLDYATGDFIFLIDVDLEEQPELLDEFFDTLETGGWDVVYGYQEKRKGGIVERTAGHMGWWLIDSLLPIRIPLNHSTVRLMTKAYRDALVLHRERMTAMGGLWVITGYRQKGVPIQKGHRGSTTYGFFKRAGALIESVTSFSETPLVGVFALGLMLLVLSSLVATVLVVRRLTGIVMDGWVSVMVSIWFFGGLTVFAIGVVGLYVARIFIETKQRPYTIVRSVYCSKPSSEGPGGRNG